MFITIDLADGENTMIDIVESEQRLKYTAIKNDDLYSIDYQLFGPINKAKSAVNTTGRNVVLVIAKADDN